MVLRNLKHLTLSKKRKNGSIKVSFLKKDNFGKFFFRKKKLNENIFELIISSIQNLVSFWALLLIAISTIYWPRTVRFERNLGFLATFCTCYIVHFSRGAIITAPTIVVIHFLLPFSILKSFNF